MYYKSVVKDIFSHLHSSIQQIYHGVYQWEETHMDVEFYILPLTETSELVTTE